MSANSRFIEIVEELKEDGKIKDYKALADSLGVSKSFISDLKAERKKISVELLCRMKNEYPGVNLQYIITGARGAHREAITTSKEQDNSASMLLALDRIQQMAEEIGSLKHQLAEAKREAAHWKLKSVGGVDVDTTAPVARRHPTL